jgi:putative SOS response-associated peptidase YedK
MCGRFNIIDDPLTQLLVEITGQGQGWQLETTYNIAPTQQVPVLTRDETGIWSLKDMRWWLVPYWSDGPTNRYAMFNAKSETLSKSRAYREPYRKRRCIVPASGYYEWKKQGDKKLPYYLEPDSEPGFAFAGLWDTWRGDNTTLLSCTIVTAAAPESMKPVHHRIPVHLTPEQARTWVAADTKTAELESLLAPELRTEIRVTPVSTHVNNARNKDVGCVEAVGEPFKIH